MSKPAILILLAAIYVAVCTVADCSAAPAANAQAVPDFTRGDTPDRIAHDWTLGPTGARGWVYAANLETTQSRQIYVTKVERGSPAHGVLSVGDVILGVGGKPFESDARIAFGKSINTAEGNGGDLQLLLWRSGKKSDVVVKLKPIGSYSETSPYNCNKSEQIFLQGCEAIAKRLRDSRQKGNPITRSLNAMALLASRNRAYLPLIKQEVDWATKFEVPDGQGFQSWWYGYVNMFLCEYALATNDRSVVPAVRRFSMAVANGQSKVGSWGHKFANPETGVLYGYGAMNAPALSLTISLALAQEVGVKHADITRAIERSERWLGFYIGKGGIPYGDHHPMHEMYDANGKSGAAAVMFDLLNNQEGAEFFAKMVTAGHGLERDLGHTGNFFTTVWPLIGASRAGPHATGGWIKAAGWRLDLARRWDGTFVYQGEPGKGVKTNDHKYDGWDTTGAELLNYAVGAKTLRITGRIKSIAPELTREEVEGLLRDGEDWWPSDRTGGYADRSTDELLEGLSSWSPVVHFRSAAILKQRQSPELLKQLVRQLRSGDLHAKLGACQALEMIGRNAAPAVPELSRALVSDEPWLQVQAGEALAAIGPAAMAAAPQLLRIATEDYPDDPRQMTQRFVAYLLFGSPVDRKVKGLLANSLRGIEPELLYEAVVAVLQNEDGLARGSVGNLYKQLSYEEIEPLLPAIIRSIEEPAPSGVMFSAKIRIAGVELLAKHHFREGIPLCITVMDADKWGKGNRIKPCLNALESYGAAAQSQIPALREVEETLGGRSQPPNKNVVMVRESIKRIQNATQAPELRNLPLAQPYL